MKPSRVGVGRPRKSTAEPASEQLCRAAVVVSEDLRRAIVDLPAALKDFGLKQSELATPTHDMDVMYGYTKDGQLMVEVELYVHWLVPGAPRVKVSEHDGQFRVSGPDPDPEADPGYD